MHDTREYVRNVVINALKQELKYEEQSSEINDDVDLVEHGLDSMAAIRIIINIEESLNISFPDDALTVESIKTIGFAIDSIERILGQVANSC